LREEDVELKPRCLDKINQLINKGVDIPNPLTVDIGEEVDLERISGKGVKIYPGCRIYGEKTVISAEAQIGYEGPVTIEDCQIGPKVELKDGYFNKAVFLEKASMGLGAHVREGCILEEQASGAHCVGLKQTILFPFVTLGSLINFCDCLMAGGTSRKVHSEVGSSYIHFNFTPDGDKATASLIGDVPRGVMLDQPPIFLGGQGGMVGPARLGYGIVVAAGTILRGDFLEDNKLIVGKPHRGRVINYVPNRYSNLSRVVENNILYLANLAALEQWYIHVRRAFFEAEELGELVYLGVLDKLALGKRERIKRLKALAEKMPASHEDGRGGGRPGAGRQEFHDKIEEVCQLFEEGATAANEGTNNRDSFLEAFQAHGKYNQGGYLEVVQGLPPAVSLQGTRWLSDIVDGFCRYTQAILPSLGIFRG
jgi:bifunctional UDP-N-acetylglucosamine pyrophosphorylase/glucosamine-1-phosphate N-acetyltransferase